MSDISDEEQAAMAIKLMDNVYKIIVNTVVEDYNSGGPIKLLIEGAVLNRLYETHPGSPMQASVTQIVLNQMANH